MGATAIREGSPWEQEAPYGTIKTINGQDYAYLPDPWTSPEGYGNAWCSVEQLEKDKIKWKRKRNLTF